MTKGAIRVNTDYQRSSAVWPPAARSYLIETILKGYPIPKLSLYQKTDLKTRTTVKEIVDGQQRSQAIRTFFENDLRISGRSEFKGKRFDQLDDDAKNQFLSYALSADVFSAATEAEIREVFRRINSYNVPLNPAEKRHATYQGEFKWFVVSLCEEYSQTLKDIGIFKEPQLARMYDAQLFSEVCRTLVEGIDHASERRLDDLYVQYDKSCPPESDFRQGLGAGISLLVKLKPLYQSPLYKQYNVYSFLTAAAHISRRFPALDTAFRVTHRRVPDAKVVIDNLSVLANALESPTPPKPLIDFVDACAEKTNRKDPREVRFRWFCKALTEKSIP